MTPLEYKQFCESTYACPPGTDREEYLRLLLIEELGEVASLFAKAMRDGVKVLGRGPGCPACGGFSVCSCCGVRETLYGEKWVDRDKLLKELGDVMWCVFMSHYITGREGWEDGLRLDLSAGRVLEAISSAPNQVYFASVLCAVCGFSPEEVALANVEKLKDRVQRGTIHGEGDER
jgi:NTP pyrophosphatase (non-canonical NTP hydrolase)